MPDLPAPTLHREGDDLIFTWEQAGISIEVRDMTLGRDGPRAEVWARQVVGGHLHCGMLNLLSTSSKAGFIKAVLGRDSGSNWADAIEQVGVMATEVYRKGDPLEVLEPRRRPDAGRYAISPLAPLGQPTLWFGDGKTLKSYVLLASCLAMSGSTTLAGMETTALRPALLDWEWDRAEHEDRLLRLGGDAGDVYYRHCKAPLYEQIRPLCRELDRAGIDIIGVDSLGFAAGGDPSDPEVALRFFGALRALERTAIVTHHIPKETKEPFGSVYIRNSARAGWLFQRSAVIGENQAVVAIRHKWTNTGHLEQPIGLAFAFDELAHTTTVARTDARDVAMLAEGLSGPEKCWLALEKPMSTSDLAELTGLKPDTVTKACDRHKGIMKVGHDGHQAMYARCSEREDPNT